MDALANPTLSRPRLLLGYVRTYTSTTVHKFWVGWYLSKFCARLMWRGVTHDLSKYTLTEASGFARIIHDLKTVEYGSPKYRENLRMIKPGISHHYLCNRHHPEHFDGGYQEMSALDRVEMVADWIAAGRRFKDSDPQKSMVINADRFGLSDDDVVFVQDVMRAMGK